MKKFLLALTITISILYQPLLVFAGPDDDASITCDDGGGVFRQLIQTGEVAACELALGANSHAQCVAIQCALERVSSRPDTKQEWWNPTLGTFSKKVFDSPKEEIFGERYAYAQVNWIINSIFTLLLPRANKMQDVLDLITIIKSLETGQIPASLQPVADIISFPFTHPVASAKDQIKITLAKLQIAPPVSAQGLGYAKLAGSANINILWTATRNMAYLISVILLIAAGFMAMFRTKINPQTVVSIQMILPKLAISLILITFSLAIVGFVIDMIYVFIVAIVGFLQITGVSPLGSLGGNVTLLTTAGTRYFTAIFLNFYTNIVYVVIVLLFLLQMIPVPGWIGWLYVPLSILLAVLIWAVISGIRIIVTLYHAYLNLILLVITGPLQIMMDIVPANHKSGFVPWFKCVVGNASVFVIAAILAIVADLLFNTFTNTSALSFNPAFNNGLVPGFTLPFIGGGGFVLGDITNLGAGGFDLLTWIFLPMVLFQIAPGIMTSIRDTLCKDVDPSKEVADVVNNLVRQLTSGKPKGSGSGRKDE